ncbi:hypothetical protein ZWY2020_040304 [Hordeum vulgare]|nr:hypothetical protein ZWY2020_040304 [Hordeum vulgare]
MTQEPLYPEGQPKRIEQDSQGVSADAPSHPRKKKKDDRDLHASHPVAASPESPNDVSVSDAETQSGDEHEPNDNIDSGVHEDAQPSNDKDVEIEPVDLDNPQPKARRYDKNDFTARKHGKEREPWVQKPMPFPPKPSKKKDDEDFERFVEMIRPVFLQMRLTDMLKMSPYAKYMKDNVTNKRRIPEVEISTMLANYTFKGGTPKKLGDKLNHVPQIHFDSSNNEAEYEVLLCGLRMAISFGVRRSMVYGDSDLVVNQVMKEWDVRNPAMTGYFRTVRKLQKKFEALEFHHVPQLKNQVAEELAKIGSTRKPIPINVFLEHLHTTSVQEDPFTEEPPQPISTCNPTEVDVPEVVDLVMEILAITPEWTVPYMHTS